ncbi:unnamed protein product [Tuber melanosporum]|uniref:(Perigord truffle) hypothetical protein n=1 Tax=Tuber melanosporum (strain Mel28) TaxID=656061 RepID=D5GKP7_TUBMM|nr:uncharacterized protein GSTUM_00009688001 [Tuber melanosporum]CAZ85090.1 unnamed protein product [Tuber melanosporum]
MPSPGTTALLYRSTLTPPRCHTAAVSHLGPNFFPSLPLGNKPVGLITGFAVLLPVMGPEIIGPREFIWMLAFGLRTRRTLRRSVIFGRIFVPPQICFAPKTYQADIAHVRARVLVILRDVPAPIAVGGLVVEKRLDIAHG